MKCLNSLPGAIAFLLPTLIFAGPLYVQPVLLSVQSGNGQVEVSWPEGLDLVQPEKTTKLTSGAWSNFGSPTADASLVDSVGNGPAFYRLRFLAPSIIQPPHGQTNGVGNNVTLSVSASGTAPLAYQWRKGDNALAGETNASLVLTNLDTTNSGNYTVFITNRTGSITSAVAVLSVTNPLVRPTGIYMGAFSGESDGGGFGVMLRSSGLAYVVGYNGPQEEGILASDVSVSPDGIFSTITAQGGKVGGTFTTSVVSGNFTNSVGQTGAYSGGRKADTGVHAADAGYYSGNYTGFFSGSAYAIVAADGTVFFFTTGGSGDGGGYGTIEVGNSFSATTIPDNLTVIGSLDQAAQTISGSYKSGGRNAGDLQRDANFNTVNLLRAVPKSSLKGFGKPLFGACLPIV